MKQAVQNLLDLADVTINGNNPWYIQVHNPAFYARVLAGGSLALGESYMDGWWDCEALDQFFDRILGVELDKIIKTCKHLIWTALKARIKNPYRKSRAFEIGKRHYNIGNDLFKSMLDKRMVYSCGYWKYAEILDQAQESKLDLICKKVGLQPGQKILDIGCGWGSFAQYAAEKYDAEAIGITVSEEQLKLGNEICSNLPVTLRLQDYRDLDETFDHIISIGMFEHVGYRSYRTFMEIVHRCLKKDGRFLLHTIGGNYSVTSFDPWIEKYIFPNSMIPSAAQITKAAEGLFVLRDWHSFGTHYDKILMTWHRNFVKNRDKIKDAYDTRFYRMWTYYFLSCAGSFRANKNQLWEIVFAKTGSKGENQNIR